MSTTKNAFDQQYKALLQRIMETGHDAKNERTGHICRSLPGAHMQFNLSEGFPLLTLRKIPLKLFIAEQIWFLMGEKKLDFLQQFTHIWNDFAEDDNTISTAYGYRWRRHYALYVVREIHGAG